MNSNLNTGIVPTHNRNLNKSVSGVVGIVTEYDDKTPSEDIIFPSRERRILLVEPKTMLVVTGYNISSDTSVIFRKVLRSNGIPAQGSSDCCCPSIIIANSIRLHSVIMNTWKLNKNNPVFIIKTPGSYEIDVVGDYADVVVSAMSFPMQPVNEFLEKATI